MVNQAPGTINREVLKAVALALLAYLVFWDIALSVAPDSPTRGIADYFHLWDSEIFQSIAENGYRFEYEMSDPLRNWQTNNVAFPPLYPLLSRFSRDVFNLPWTEAMLLVSQLACLTALTFLVLIARRLGVTGIWGAFVLLAFALYPGSVWLLAVYSDSLSLALAFAIMYVALGVLDRPTHSRGVVLFTLGILLGLTHFRTSVLTAAGVMMGLTWWMRGQLDSRTVAEKLRIGVLVSLPVIGAAMAMLGFFAFCHIKFGRWDAYQQTIFGVWGVSTADFLQVFDSGIYSWFEVSLEQDRFDQSTPYLGRFLATWFLSLSLVFLVFEMFFGRIRAGRGRGIKCSPGTWALLSSMLMQYFLITMRVPSLNNFLEYPMPSVRYLIPCALLLAIYVAQLIPEILRSNNAPRDASIVTGYTLCSWLLLFGLIFQLQLFELFYQGILQG